MKCFDENGEALDSPSPFGTCQGAILANYASTSQSLFREFMTSQDDPVTVITNSPFDRGAPLLQSVHDELMAIHGSQLQQVGLNASDIPEPTGGIMGVWYGGEGLIRPCWGNSGNANSETLRQMRKPIPEFEMYVASGAYSSSGAWAVGGLIQAETLMRENFGLPRPSWLDQSWYDRNVMRSDELENK